jgi:hypothetical protein
VGVLEFAWLVLRFAGLSVIGLVGGVAFAGILCAAAYFLGEAAGIAWPSLALIVYGLALLVLLFRFLNVSARTEEVIDEQDLHWGTAISIFPLVAYVVTTIHPINDTARSIVWIYNLALEFLGIAAVAKGFGVVVEYWKDEEI